MAEVLSNDINQWAFKTQHVQPDALQENGRLGNFMSSESIVLAAGPASMGDFDASTYIPIGVCDAVQIGQNKTIQQLWEIGSREPYFIPGRTFITGSIGRVLFNGDSLMAAMYNGVSTEGMEDPAGSVTNLHGVSQTNGNMFINLASDLFNRPFGLCLFMKDSENEWVAAFVLENCFIQAHSLVLQSQQIVVGENIQFRCTKIVPVSVSAG
jgi:hypothetical protein